MNKLVSFILGFILICIATWLLLTQAMFVRLLLDRLDNIGYDIQLNTHFFYPHAAKIGPISIIDIDDKSLQVIGKWPWPRSKLAELVNALKKQGAAIVAFDIFFSEKERNMAAILSTELAQRKLLTPNLAANLEKMLPTFNDDELLAESFIDYPTVLAIGFLPRRQTQNTLPPPLFTLNAKARLDLDLYNASGYISNIPELQQTASGSGFINIFPDSDGIIRRAPLLMSYQGQVYPSLALQVLMTYLHHSLELVTPSYGTSEELEGVKVGENIIPTDSTGQVLIPFIGKSYTFPFFSAIDVLTKQIPTNALRDKIVFIGTSATGMGDLVPTAIANPFPGVEIQATLLNGMLQHQFSYKPKWVFGATLILTIILGLVATFLFPYFGPRTLVAIILLFPPIMLLLNNYIWSQTGIIFSFLIPIILILTIAFMNMIYGYVFETRRRERLKEMFGQYVPAKHIDEMLHSKGDFSLKGENRNMSVLFADIRNFTSISENLSAAELAHMLNTYFTPMTKIIFRHRGTIDKYVGDMIMAFWGAPMHDKQHARHTIQSAIDMQAKLTELNLTMREHHWPEISIGIGINSGIMSVGDMGSRFRRNYTVLGDEVNLASRIEGLTKFYGVNIIVTAQTKQHQKHFVFRKLDRVKVKGKEKSMEIYEVLGNHDKVSPEIKQEAEVFHLALEKYFDCDFNRALITIQQLLYERPDCKLYQLYKKRLDEFIQTPPPKNWNGVFAHTAK